MQKIAVVIPCFNEEARLDLGRLDELFERENLIVILVDDGSTDRTRTKLEAYVREHPTRASVLCLATNSGKAEAVRRGLLSGLSAGASYVGYLDADLATPPKEMLVVVEEALRTGASVAMASRILLLGRHVERSALRHYLGRIFATGASLALRINVYDTQCGAKVLKDTPALRFALSVPFRSHWAFDVELIKRMLLCPEAPLEPQELLEVPLNVWQDRAGSKLTPQAMLKAGLDLLEMGLSPKRRFLNHMKRG